ncbi:MAG: hypothetical protein ACREJT_05475, partial [Myxococcota bacterium]
MSAARWRAAALATVLALLAAALPTPAAASDGINLTGLHVYGGNVWHSENQFHLEWDPNPPTEAPSEVRYELLGAGGWILPGFPQVTVEAGLGSATISVPPIPGVYLFELWVHKTNEAATPNGPGSVVPLYFDDARAPAVSVSAPAWVAAGSPVPIRVAPPTAALPVSGIQGYAVSIDGTAGASPCARADRCASAEVDLPVGNTVGTISLPAPPEGVSYVHAVAVSGSGMDSARAATLAIGVDGTPPQVRLEGAPAGWAPGPVKVTAVASDPLSGMAAVGPGGPE